MTTPRLFRAAALLLLAVPACAQSTPAAQPTLPVVLTRVQANFARFLQTVPNLVADEHLTTDVGYTMSTAMNSVSNLARTHGVEADSVFTLRHDTQLKDATPRLHESREIKVIDHRPVQPGATLDAPTMLYGAFSYAGAFLQPQLTNCYDYKLKTNQKLQGRAVLIVEYEHNQKNEAPGTTCMVPEPHSGRAFIDPNTMQILRLEQHRPHYVTASVQITTSGEAIPFKITVAWDWAVDYAPVQLDGQTFLLPKTISSSMKALPGNDKPTPSRWSFLATYTNYHLLSVHSRIVPVAEGSPR